MKIYLRQKNKAFTLVETLVAISIFTVSLLGLMSVLASGITDTTYAKQKMTATYLAQEGIEYIRNARDNYVLSDSQSGWNLFIGAMGQFTLVDEGGFDDPASNPFEDAIHHCATYNCKLYVNNGSYNTNSTGTDSGFVRKFWTAPVSADEIKIFSKVEWSQGSGLHSVTFSENLFNWVE